MEAVIATYAERIRHYTSEQLFEECLQRRRNEIRLETSLTALRESDTQMAIDHQALQEKCRILEADLKHMCERNQYLLSQSYGSHNEKLDAIFTESGQDHEDPLSEDCIPEDEHADKGESVPSGSKYKADSQDTSSDPDKEARKAARKLAAEALGDGRKKKTPSKMDRSRLPHVDEWVLNVKSLNKKYGENGWEIVGWHSKELLQRPLASCYVEDRHTPVLRDRKTGDLICLSDEDVFYKHSCATSSFVASLIYEKTLKAVPINMQSTDFEYRGLTIPRQDLSNWFVHFCEEYFSIPYFYMRRLQLERSYAQADETTLLVLHEDDTEGRKTTTKSFVWVHTTGEFDDEKPIVIYCYEPTRGTDHLREYYAGYTGHLTSDAYISYDVLCKESDGRIVLCGCLMHSRRRFADALKLINVNKLTAEQIHALPEYQVLQKFGEIYHLEGELKALSPDERLSRRQSEVKPLIKELYTLIDSVDLGDPLISDKLKDAVSYSMNHKEELCRFLEDGRIPCDNGYCERSIRIVARGRRTWLFANTARGAKASMYAYSMVETACQNKANPLIYLKYLLEKVPGYMDLPFNSPRLEELMPWSGHYRLYEKAQLEEEINRMYPIRQKKPHYRPWAVKTVPTEAAS